MTDLLFWLDMETTGLNGPGDPLPAVLEVAWAFTGPAIEPPGEVRHEFSWDPWYTAAQLWEEDGICHPVARTMHEASGLRAEWEAWAADGSHRGNLETLDATMAVELEQARVAAGAERVAVAGSGVGPFDVPLLRAYFPVTAGSVHYRPLDISSVRALARLVGVTSPFEAEARPHRAAGDVAFSVAEGRWWRTWLADAAARLDPAERGAA